MTRTATNTTARTPTELAPIVVARSRDEAMALLVSAARRGELPEFKSPAKGGDFSVAVFSEPLDHVMTGTFEGGAGGTVLALRVRMQRRIPVAFWVLSALAVWPGVQLTHSMLTIYFPGYRYATWMWYLPLTILPLPWAWFSVVKKSRAKAAVASAEGRAKLAKILGEKQE